MVNGITEKLIRAMAGGLVCDPKQADLVTGRTGALKVVFHQ